MKKLTFVVPLQAQRLHEKKEHSTQEQALDPKTRLMLFKLVDGGVLAEVNGCISTGKEACVYHAAGGRCVYIVCTCVCLCIAYVFLCLCDYTITYAQPSSPAVVPRIALSHQSVPSRCSKPLSMSSRTEIDTLRTIIVSRTGLASRILVKLSNSGLRRRCTILRGECVLETLIWRILGYCLIFECAHRLSEGGVKCPEVVLLKKHVLIMSFIGRDMKPAPKLKEVRLSVDKMKSAYQQCVKVRSLKHAHTNVTV